MDDIAQNIIDAGESGLWNSAIPQLQGQLKITPNDQATLNRLGLIYRQNGDLKNAAEVYEKLAKLDNSNLYAEAVSQLCFGSIHPETRFPEDVHPARFIRNPNFLAPDKREKLISVFAQKQSEMEELAVTRTGGDENATDEIDRTMRHQFGHYCKAELEQLVHSEVMDRFSDFCATLNIDEFVPGDISLRLDYTPHGGFGKMHQDVGLDAKLSYLYYFHTLPKKFSGGDLLFFDQSDEEDLPVVNQFTRIVCEDNLLIVFPPKYFHQVTRVRALNPPMSPQDSRLSVCGFIHASHGQT